MPGRSSLSLHESEPLQTSITSIASPLGREVYRRRRKRKGRYRGFSKRFGQVAAAMAAIAVPAPAIGNQHKYSDAIYLEVFTLFVLGLARYFTSVSLLTLPRLFACSKRRPQRAHVHSRRPCLMVFIRIMYKVRCRPAGVCMRMKAAPCSRLTFVTATSFLACAVWILFVR